MRRKDCHSRVQTRSNAKHAGGGWSDTLNTPVSFAGMSTEISKDVTGQLGSIADEMASSTSRRTHGPKTIFARVLSTVGIG